MKAALAVSHQSQIVIDVGANYGSFSLFALSFGAKEVLAFEPQDKVSTLLINRFFFFKVSNDCVNALVSSTSCVD